MVKKILPILITLFFLSFVPKVNALENFSVKVNAEYKIEENGKTFVTKTFSIKNKTSEFFSKSYLIKMSGINPENLKAYESGNELRLFTEKIADKTNVKIEFNDPVVGKGRERNFVVSFQENSLAKKTGEVWEVLIPKLEDENSYDEFNVYLSIPEIFGDEAYISPEPRERKVQNGKKIYLFKKDDITNTGISASFGKFQVFDFTINYHLQNTSNEKKVETIAVPPDTSTQEVFYQSLIPTPSNLYTDEDGNWIASYTLSPKQKIDIKLTGSVSIFARPRKLINPSPSYLLTNLKPTQFWQSDDPQIKNLAKSLSSPFDIYHFVTKNLKYNYQRVKPNTQRLGAKSAINNPNNSICMEFTDLFIALARSNGIPAREINGYAYSENLEIQPLSLVADVLHSWPEYWDKEKETWIPVDPTWGSTSGEDFFNKLDLKHFAFVIHGKNPSEPISAGSYKLGENPQKDVFVTPSYTKTKKPSNVKIEISYPKNITIFSKTANVRVVNKGETAVYDITTQILFDQTSIYSEYFSVLPPFAHIDKKIKIPIGILGSKSPVSAKVVAYRQEVPLKTFKKEAIIYQLLILCLILVITTFYTSYKMRTRLLKKGL